MPVLEHEKAIKEYYEQVKDKYPDIDFERFREICKAPFRYIVSRIREGNLPIIMVKHLGKFIPSIRRVRERLKTEQRFFEMKITTEEEFIKNSTYLQNYINDYKNEISREVIDDTEEGETSD